MARFVLQVPEVESKGHLHHAFELDEGWLREALADTEFDAAEGFSAPFAVSARMVMDDVLVEGRFSVSLVVPCSRCNGGLPLMLDGDFTQLFSSGTSALPEELELTPEDLDRETFSGETIELDSFVREFILLEVPMAPRCEGPDVCLNPDVARFLGSGDPQKRPGPLAALGDLAQKMREKKGEGES